MALEYNSLGGSKPIVLTSGNAGGVMYTVPAGKTFRGTILVPPSATVGFNSGQPNGPGANTAWDIDVTLPAGTVVKNGTGYVSILGVEE